MWNHLHVVEMLVVTFGAVSRLVIDHGDNVSAVANIDMAARLHVSCMNQFTEIDRKQETYL